jgi:HesB-like selenoprotein
MCSLGGKSMETTKKEVLTLSEGAYTEFKSFLASNNVTDNNIRISLAGYACSGPRFGLMVDAPGAEDLVATVNDINFIVEKNLYEEFEGFQILSSEENFGQGMVLRPNKVDDSAGGCSSCSGC